MICFRVLLLFIFPFLTLTFRFFSVGATEPDTEGLFVETSPPGRPLLHADAHVSRTRYVMVMFDRLTQTSMGESLYLNLFEGDSYYAVIDRIEPQDPSRNAYTGHLEGVEHSQFVLITQDNQMVGDIITPGAAFQVRYAGEGIHAISAVDQAALPPEAEPIPVYSTEEPMLPDLPSSMVDDGSQIDVLVVYTPATRAAAGGMTAVQNLVNLAVVETNQSYANSGIIQRLNLVYAGEVAYNESGNMYTDLSRLTYPGDGYLDSVHNLRDTYQADVVSMLEESSQYCGIAWLMTDVSTSFSPYAFNVIARQCAAGNYTFGHELGHNMGARHDWYVDDTLDSPFSYNKGFINVRDRWRTVMSYNSECSDQGLYCTRLPYWSNPGVLYGGDAMGVPEGTATNCQEYDLNHPPCDADNRLTLNNTANVVANFRQSGSSVVGPLAYESHIVDDDSTGNSQGNSNGIIECGESIELYVSLRNLGSEAAAGVSASISLISPYVSGPLYNSSSSYADIIAGGIGMNLDDFDFLISPDAPQGHPIHFDIDISASNGGPWSDSFEVVVNCDAHASIAVEPNPLVSTQEGETIVTLPLQIHNNGGAELTWAISEQAPSGDEGARMPALSMEGSNSADGGLMWEQPYSNYPESGISWISIMPVSGDTPAGGTSMVSVTFNSEGLFPGTYNQQFYIYSSDPQQPVYPVSIELLVDNNSRFFLPLILAIP